MVKRRLGWALVVVMALLSALYVWNVGQAVAMHWSNFRKMEQWIAIKQAQEEQERQRVKAAQAQPPPQAAAPQSQ